MLLPNIFLINLIYFSLKNSQEFLAHVNFILYLCKIFELSIGLVGVYSSDIISVSGYLFDTSKIGNIFVTTKKKPTFL